MEEEKEDTTWKQLMEDNIRLIDLMRQKLDGLTGQLRGVIFGMIFIILSLVAMASWILLR